tara:strand:- start:1952 stop:2389 length:438 start_codon:yes stop_codon:yes gene_type:complete
MSSLAPYYLIFKALHIAFMVTWFAGLFYLPRLFIYHAEAADTVGRARFCVMEKRLFVMMTLGAVLTAVFGLLLLGINHSLLGQGWFQIKLALLAGLIVYHLRCYHWIRRLRAAEAPSASRWLRLFNEIPVFFLLVIVLLAILKPA